MTTSRKLKYFLTAVHSSMDNRSDGQAPGITLDISMHAPSGDKFKMAYSTHFYIYQFLEVFYFLKKIFNGTSYFFKRVHRRCSGYSLFQQQERPTIQTTSLSSLLNVKQSITWTLIVEFRNYKTLFMIHQLKSKISEVDK